MKTLYIEPFSGVAGDMFVAALFGLGIDFDAFNQKLSSLSVEEKWDISIEKVSRHSISANLFNVKINLLSHNHNYTHHHRSLDEIKSIINGADKLPEVVKQNALSVFAKLAEAEAEVHGKDIEAVHFHEVGALDAIVDICGACLALDMLCIDKIISTPVALGTGTVKTAHGILPVPVPATVNLLRGIPTENTGIKSELSTPTGSALLATLVDEWCKSPNGTSSGVSYGAGTRDLKERAAVLRVSLYEGCAVSETDTLDNVAVIECNIDDMPGEALSWIFPKIMQKGALDFSIIPVSMKKDRHGFILQIISRPDEVVKFSDFLLNETTTIGVRYRKEKRIKLNREIRKIETPWGEILAKFATDSNGKVIKFKPEYESVAELAEMEGVPYLEMYNKILIYIKP